MSLIQDPEDPTRYIISYATSYVLGMHQGPSVLTNVHLPDRCANEHCVIHNPSDHHMLQWSLVWRGDKGVFERTCPHGVGHPDPDDAAFQIKVGREYLTTHGCDGCCRPS